MKKVRISGLIAALALVMTSCYNKEQKASEDSTSRSTGVEFAPQMYHAEAYEPMTQVTDKEAGLKLLAFRRSWWWCIGL